MSQEDFDFSEYRRAGNRELKYAMLNLNFKDNYGAADFLEGKHIDEFLESDEDGAIRRRLDEVLKKDIAEILVENDNGMTESDRKIRDELTKVLGMTVSEFKSYVGGR